jgi:large-conductance mechanosensitive channel
MRPKQYWAFEQPCSAAFFPPYSALIIELDIGGVAGAVISFLITAYVVFFII